MLAPDDRWRASSFRLLWKRAEAPFPSRRLFDFSHARWLSATLILTSSSIVLDKDITAISGSPQETLAMLAINERKSHRFPTFALSLDKPSCISSFHSWIHICLLRVFRRILRDEK